MADDFKYHIDHHASLVAPQDLVDARAAHAVGEIGDDQLRAAQDAAIRDVLRIQRRIGLSAVSDGEYRRRNYLAPVYDGVDGFAERAHTGGALVQLVGRRHAPELRALHGSVTPRGRLVRTETDFVASVVDRPVLVALPSPGFVAELGAEGNGGQKVDVATAGAELAAVLRAEIAAAAADGVRHVLLRNPAYGFLVTAAGCTRATELGLAPDALLKRMLAADAQVLDGLDTPAEFRLSLDLTTGGEASGPFDQDAVRLLLDGQPYDRLCVEYGQAEDDRFPIELLADGTVVSLGVVDVGQPEAEDVDGLVARIDRAADVVDIDDIAISTNGGFHAARQPLTVGQQQDKLQLVEMVARYFWGNEL